jgi:ribokinase
MPKRPVITVIGSMIYDFVAFAHKMPEQGETVKGDGFGMFTGGKGANQAVQVGRLGATCYMAGMIGRDFMGKAILDSLRSSRVKTKYVMKHPEAKTACCCIHVANGENRIIIALQANDEYSLDYLDQVEPVIRQSDVILLQYEIPAPTVERAVSLAKQHGKKVILNPAPFRPASPELIEQVDYLTPNYIEALALVDHLGKELPLPDLAAELVRIKKSGYSIVTLGAKGSLIVTPQESTLVPAYSIQALDETAAGDAFNGALAVVIGEGMGLVEAVKYANAAGAIAASRKGAQSSIGTRDEIEAFIRQHGGLKEMKV